MGSRGKLLFWLLVAAGLVVGAIGMYQRVGEGMRSTNLNQIVPWGLWVAFYIFFIGLSAGSFLLSTLIYVGGLHQFERVGRLALWTAFCCLAAGMLFVLMDIGRMGRFATVFWNRNGRSVLSWEIHLYVIYLIILLAELWLLCRRDLVRWSQRQDRVGRVARFLTLGVTDLSDEALRRDMAWVKALGLIGIPTAIGVHGGTGAIFAVVKARPYWYTGLFPIVFVVSALASGGGLLTALTAFFTRFGKDKNLVRSLGTLTIGILAFDLLLLASELLVGLYGRIPDHTETLHLMMSGPFAWVFWGLQLGIGAALPILILLLPALRNSPRWVGLAGAAVVAGVFGVRLNIVIPPQAFPVLSGLDRAVATVRQNPLYVPNANEWLVSIFLLAAVLALFALGKSALPLEEEPVAVPETRSDRRLATGD